MILVVPTAAVWAGGAVWRKASQRMSRRDVEEGKQNWEEEKGGGGSGRRRGEDRDDKGSYSDDEDYQEEKESKHSRALSPTLAAKKISGAELINKVQKYFYEDEEFTKTFENFVKDECDIIDLSSEEYKLEYTEIYEKYKVLFEEKLESFIESQGCTPLDFYKALKETSDNDPDSAHAVFGQILVAVVDFDIFMVMMREMAQSNSRMNRK